MLDSIAIPIGIIISWIYNFTSNYLIAIVGLAFVVRMCMFPIEYIVGKTALKFLLVEDEVNLKKYELEREIRITQGGLKGWANPWFILIPSVFQMFIIFGVLRVVCNPLTYILGLPKDYISALKIDLTYSFDNPASELDILSVGWVDGIPLTYYGIDILGFSGLVVILVVLSIIGLSLVYSKCDLLFKTKSLNYQLIRVVVMVVIFGGFTFFMPAVLGIYWIAYNIFASISLIIIEFIRCKRERMISLN